MWCVLVNHMTVGPYRLRRKAAEMAEAINRKIELHAPYNAENWDEGRQPHAWVQKMRTNRTEVYEDLGIRRLS